MFLRDMVCLRNISVDTLHKGDTDDDNDGDDDDDDNIIIIIIIIIISKFFINQRMHK